MTLYKNNALVSVPYNYLTTQKKKHSTFKLKITAE